jgi:Rieske Fe-S protein
MRKTESSPHDPSRRAFLVRSASAVGVVGLATACGGRAAFHKKDIQVEVAPDAESVSLPLARHPKLAEPGGIVRVEGHDGDARIMVIRKADGSLVALSMECTHWGCDVDWVADKGELDCPCHGSRFGTAGNVLEGPADEPLPSYPVSEADGIVTLGLTRTPRGG